MPVKLKKTVAALEGVCGVEEAETLLGWLTEHPNGKVNLKRCEHLHTAVLQVLMAVGPRVSAWPQDPFLEELLRSSLRPAGAGGGGP